MEPDPKVKAKIAFLNEEMDILHVANSSYWGEKHQTTSAKVLYQVRQHRLDEIRTELDRLRTILHS
jgi:hypothetical protein